MFTTGSKLFLGATALSVVAAVVYGLPTAGRRLARRHRPAQRCRRVRLPLRRQLLRPRRQRLGDVGERHDRSARGATAGRAQHVAGVVGAWRSAPIAVGHCRSRSCSRPASCCCSPRRSSGWCRRWSERASADAAYNAGLRKRMLHPLEFPVLAAVGLGRPHLLVLADHAVDRQERRPGRVRHRRRARAVRRLPLRLEADPQEERRRRRLHHRRARSRQHRCRHGRRRSAHDRPSTRPRAPTTVRRARSAEEGTGEQAEVDEQGLAGGRLEGQRRAHRHARGRQAHARTSSASPATLDTVTVSRGNTVNMIFKNHDAEPRRLTVNMGEFEQRRQRHRGQAATDRPARRWSAPRRQPVPDVHAAQAVDRQQPSRTRSPCPVSTA